MMAALTLGLGLSTAAPAVADDKPKYPKAKIVLSGELIGEGYKVETDALLFTSKKYEESWMEVDVLKTDDSSNRTPMLTVTLRKGKLVCETFKGWIWSTSEGSTLTLKCETYVSSKTLKKVKTGVVS